MKDLQYFQVKSAKSMEEDLNIWMEGHDTSMDWKTQYFKDFSSLQINPQSNAILIKFSKKKKKKRIQGNWKIDSKTFKGRKSKNQSRQSWRNTKLKTYITR